MEAGYQTKSYRCDLICTHTICSVSELFGSKRVRSRTFTFQCLLLTLWSIRRRSCHCQTGSLRLLQIFPLVVLHCAPSGFGGEHGEGSPGHYCLIYKLISSTLQNLVPTGVNYVIILSCTVVLTLSGFSRSISSSRVTWEASGNCNGGGTKVMATVLRKLREMRTVLSERIIRFK